MSGFNAASSAHKSLVLVLGAGASHEVDLPVGSGLVDSIAKKLQFPLDSIGRVTGGDPAVHDAFHQLARSGGPETLSGLFGAAAKICPAMIQAMSIDNFIDSHKDDPHVAIAGKIAIAACIWDAEKTSKLRVDSSNKYNHIAFGLSRGTWYNAMFQTLVENCRAEEVVKRFEKVAVISFNYDRCFEHYMHGSLQNYYGMSEQAATHAMESLEVLHPYGRVGSLPWMQADTPMPFGGDYRGHHLAEVISQLRTFSERTDPMDVGISRIRRIMTTADRTVFLGFAFHSLNMELLFPFRVAPGIEQRRIYATGKGISSSDAQLIEGDLRGVTGLDNRMIDIQRDLTCTMLINQYRRSLSLVSRH